MPYSSIKFHKPRTNNTTPTAKKLKERNISDCFHIVISYCTELLCQQVPKLLRSNTAHHFRFKKFSLPYHYFCRKLHRRAFVFPPVV